ncbi:MAG: HD domain-containing protein, partial [Cyanobacteria bacterium REEB65]|nr:HD domain-containing protein [Cyanobacteria bacterium REEB65]
GGEELAILLPHTDGAGAVIVAERIRSALQQSPLETPTGEDVTIQVSFGVAGHKLGLTSTELLEGSERALQVAKSQGRNRVSLDGSPEQVPIEDLRREREQAQGAFMDTIRALSEAVDTKDRYTGGHIRHVQALVRALGRQLGLDRRQIRDAEMTAIMHDVGKIGIPDAVLQKPGPLDDDEWRIMRTHPILGARILMAGNLHGLALGIRHHHERWDGKGYPDGVKGGDIPLSARIVSVVDAWGAMTTDRVYRKSIGVRRALDELQRGAGTQFDPDVVNAFVLMMESRLERGQQVAADQFEDHEEAEAS